MKRIIAVRETETARTLEDRAWALYSAICQRMTASRPSDADYDSQRAERAFAMAEAFEAAAARRRGADTVEISDAARAAHASVEGGQA